MNDYNDNNDNKISAIIGIGGVLLSMIVLILGARTNSGVLTVIGVILFVLAIVSGIIIGKLTDAAEKAKYMHGLSGGSAKVMSKYQPLLMDERTKQDPDVQRLLQYTSVQKAFFDPDYISSAAAQNDPYVRELMEVLDRMSDNGAVIGGFGQFVDVDPSSAYANEIHKREADRQRRGQNKPRRTVGKTLVGIGVALFMLPFLAVFFGGPNMNFVYFMGAPPLGMLLVVIGKIIRK